MTANPIPTARRRRTMRRVVLLVLVALLVPIAGTGAPAGAATSATGALALPGAVAPVVPSSDLTAVSATLVREAEAYNRQEAEIARQAKALVAEAERITKDAAALRTATTAFNSKTTAVSQKTSSFNSRAAALNAKISAHNSKPHTFRLPAQAAAANAYEAEASSLRAEQSQLRATKSSLQSEQNQLRQQGSKLRANKSQLSAASSAHDSKADALRSKEQQLQALGKQLLQKMAQAVQSLADSPPDPAAMMDRGGDAADPPQYREQSQGQDSGLADSPSRQPQVSALTAYGKRTGTTVDVRPGTAYLTPEAIRQLPASRAAQLGSPSTTYDGLVRKPNGHYTALRVRTPGATATPGQKAFKTALTKRGRLVAYKSDVKLIIDELKSVPAGAGASDPGPGTEPPDRDGKADCLKRDQGRRSGGGWILNTSQNVPLRDRTVDPGPPGSRAGRAEACLTRPLGGGSAATKSSITGWRDANAKAPGGGLARCHLIANVVGGKGWYQEDWNNLVPCHQRGMNTKGISMRQYEILVEQAVRDLPENAAVHYVVTPLYRNGDSTIPQGVTMNASVQLPNGASWPVFNETSLLNIPHDNGPNLGN